MINFSIIIPVYNSHAFLDECIQSALNTNIDKDSFEIILVDDCSDKKYIEIYKQYISNNVKYIRINERSGAGIARMEGVKIASGKYCTFLDSDDKVDPDYYKDLLDAAKKDPQCDVIIGNIMRRASKEDVWVKKYTPPDMTIKKSQYINYFLQEQSDNISLWNKIYKTALFEGLTPLKGRFTYEEAEFHFYIYDRMSYAKTIKMNSYYWYTGCRNYAAKYPYFPLHVIKKYKELYSRKDIPIVAKNAFLKILRYDLDVNREYLKTHKEIPEF